VLVSKYIFTYRFSLFIYCSSSAHLVGGHVSSLNTHWWKEAPYTILIIESKFKGAVTYKMTMSEEEMQIWVSCKKEWHHECQA
jgi:hypothetical protein